MKFQLSSVVLLIYYVASPSMGQGNTCIAPRIILKSNNATCSVGSPIGSGGALFPKDDLKNLEGKLKVDLKDPPSSLMVPLLQLYLNC